MGRGVRLFFDFRAVNAKYILQEHSLLLIVLYLQYYISLSNT